MESKERRSPLVLFGLVALVALLGWWFALYQPGQRRAEGRHEVSRWMQEYVRLVEHELGPFDPGQLSDADSEVWDRIHALQDGMAWQPDAMHGDHSLGYGVAADGGLELSFYGALGRGTFSTSEGQEWSNDVPAMLVGE